MPRTRPHAIRRPVNILNPHNCEYCEQPLEKRKAEPIPAYNRRRFCSVQHHAWFRDKGGPCPTDPRLIEPDRTPEPILEVFPGAKYETPDEAPATCPCGGPWDLEPGGLGCRLCGKRIYIVSAMRLAVRRGYAATDPSRVIYPRGFGD